MSAWMLYALAIGSLLWIAGQFAERVALAGGRSTRWIWLAAIAASTAVPLLLPAWNARYGPVGSDAANIAGIGPIQAVGGIGAIDTSVTGPSAWLERALAFGWGASSLTLLAFFLVSATVLRQRRRRWPLRVVAGMPVLVSERTGPALVGFAAPDIVVPEWVLDWDERALRLLVAHEREHDRAGDPLLLLVAAAALVLLPWNLPLWWQVRRLRLAIEVDCDARVLRRHPDPRRYGLLLLEVGALASRGAVPVAAFSESSSLLERRMRVLSGAGGIRRPAAVLFALAALAGPAAVFAIPVPASPDLPSPAAAPAPSAANPATAGASDPGGVKALGGAIDTIPDPAQPDTVPYDTPPQLLPEARERIVAALASEYPPMLRDAGVTGTVTLWMFVDSTGRVTEARVAGASGHAQLDSAAVRVAGEFSFAPARRDGAAVPVWIQVPVQFSPRTGEVPSVPEQRQRIPIYTSPAAEPPFTPYEVPPALRNREEFSLHLQRLFPPVLRDAGVQATATYWLFVDSRGQVGDVRLVRTSGYDEIDEAGAAALQEAEFTPARNRDEPVAVWIQLPVAFASDGDEEVSGK